MGVMQRGRGFKLFFKKSLVFQTGFIYTEFQNPDPPPLVYAHVEIEENYYQIDMKKTVLKNSNLKP